MSGDRGLLRWSRVLLFCLLSSVLYPLSAKEAAPLAENEAVEQRMIAISEDLRCLVCQNESLAASQADLAQDLRREIREMIAQGKSDKEIVDFLVGRYGDFVRYRPPLKNTTLLLWFGPFLLAAFGVAGLVLYLRRRDRRVAEAALSDTERRSLERLLDEVERAEGKRPS